MSVPGGMNDQQMSSHTIRESSSAAEPAQRPSARTLVIIPTYNERENLPLIVGAGARGAPDVHVLVVDDSSPDGTGELADELAARRPGPRPCHAPHQQGRAGRGLPGRLRLGSEPRVLGARRDGRRRQPRPRGAATGCSTPSTRAPTWRSGRATSTAARCATGRGGGWSCRRTANRYSRIAARRRHPRHHRRLPRLPAGSAGEDRPGRGRLEGLLLPDRPDLAHDQRGFIVVEVPITFVERELGVSKMSGSNIREAIVKVARVGHRAAAWTGRAASAR